MSSVTIMAHPARRQFVDSLFLSLDHPPAVVWDHRNDRWDTGRRALLNHDPGESHHIVIQDDAIPCRDFVAAANLAIEATPGNVPVCFYIGRVRPHRQTVTPAVEQALREGRHWFVHEGPWWGVAVAIPTIHIEELVAWCDDRHDLENYDRRMSRWFGAQKIKCWYTVPSLVQHRAVNENPSLIKGRTGNRQAHEFIGTKQSPLEIDWSVTEEVAA